MTDKDPARRISRRLLRLAPLWDDEQRDAIAIAVSEEVVRLRLELGSGSVLDELGRRFGIHRETNRYGEPVERDTRYRKRLRAHMLG